MTGHNPQSDRFLRVSADELSVHALYEPDAGVPGVPEGRTPAEADIQACLSEREIAEDAIRTDAISDLIQRISREPDARHETLVASGTPPQPGEDGRLELHVPTYNPASLKPTASEDHRDDPDNNHGASAPDSGRDARLEDTDHYAGPTFHTVSLGERIGTLYAPTEGTEGVDVFGRPRPARDGAPANATIGEAIDQEGEALIAACSGVLWTDGATFWVSDTLKLPGDVDFATGHIDFPGSIAIAGGVRDRFHVRASGDIKIRGLIEAATIEAEGDIHVAQGMSARDKGRLTAGGSLTAKYLDSADVSVTGDCSIDRELNQCRVDIGGELTATRATMVGGVLRVAGAAEIASLGTPASPPTEVHLGTLASIESLIARSVTLAQSLDDEASRIEEQMQRARRKRANDDPDAADELARLKHSAALCRNRRGALNQTIARMAGMLESRARVQLTARKAIHPNTVLVVAGVRYTIRSELKGPIVIELDASGQPVARDANQDAGTPIDQLADAEPDPHSFDRQALRARLEQAA